MVDAGYRLKRQIKSGIMHRTNPHCNGGPHLHLGHVQTGQMRWMKEVVMAGVAACLKADMRGRAFTWAFDICLTR